MAFKLSNFKHNFYHDLRDFLIIKLEDSSVQKTFKKFQNYKKSKKFILLNDIIASKEIPNTSLKYFKLSLITKRETAYTYEHYNLTKNKSLLIIIDEEDNKDIEFLITYIMSDMKVRFTNMTNLCKSNLHQNNNHYHFHFEKSDIVIYRNKGNYIKYWIYLIIFIVFTLFIIIIGCL